jgi:acetyl-CoA carboxylase biotin carboxyl carrier protein
MLDPKLIRRLARIMSGEGLTELEFDDKETGLKLTLKRGEPAIQTPGPYLHVLPGGVPAPGPGSAGPPVPASGGEGAGVEEGVLPPGTVMIESPMVGTFYCSPSPESGAYTEVGARIEPDSVVCIVEAMKVMNEIKAEVSGVITEILVGDGEPVEFGQPLFLVKKG